MEELLKLIYHRLIKEEWTALPEGLKGGKVGLMLFLGLYSDSFGNRYSRNLSSRILIEMLLIGLQLPCGLLLGRMGLAWSLFLLCQKGIVEKDKELDNFLNSTIIMYMRQYYSMPIQVIAEDDLFSGGIFMLQQRVEDNSLEQYMMDERLIGMVDECERQLTRKIKYIYNSEDISLSRLHSILFFLLEINKMKMYPYKANKLLNQIEGVYSKIKKNSLADEYIYHTLMADGKANVPKGLEISALFLFMGEVGFYSLLYGLPIMFYSALEQLKDEYPLCLKKIKMEIKSTSTPTVALCGWGYGLLQCKMNGYV